MAAPTMPGLNASADINRVTAGVGEIGERTIAIGDTVLAVDNIGSIVMVSGAPNHGLLVFGGIAVFAGLLLLGSSTLQAMLATAIGVALIVINLNQKVDKGLSIGTCDNRVTLIVSNDAAFLGEMLEFIRRKVDTGNLALRGKFDVTNNHFFSEGGGIVIGDHGAASGAGGGVQVR